MYIQIHINAQRLSLSRQSEGRCLVVDTNVVLHQIDFLENASAEAGHCTLNPKPES